jgi:hypothetical protein
VPWAHRRVLSAIATCRTEAQGGHLRQCDQCGQTQYRYHSCRNRHCPKCHGEQTRRWLATQRARLLPCPYFLVTFTLPRQLRPLARARPRAVYDALLRSAAGALLTLAADPKRLGARPGLLAVLHTWTQDLRFHPHVHVLVTAGGLRDDQATWTEPRRSGFLFPGRVLSKRFRTLMWKALGGDGLLNRVPAPLWRRPWVVHLQHAGAGDKVLDYLGRYVFRIAITNTRLESFAEGRVTFRTRNRRSGSLEHCMLSADEFLARFLQHVLPPGFTKVRHYGLFSPTCRVQRERARRLLTADVESHTVATPVSDNVPLPSARDEDRCPSCHTGRLHVIATLARQRPPP